MHEGSWAYILLVTNLYDLHLRDYLEHDIRCYWSFWQCYLKLAGRTRYNVLGKQRIVGDRWVWNAKKLIKRFLIDLTHVVSYQNVFG